MPSTLEPGFHGPADILRDSSRCTEALGQMNDIFGIRALIDEIDAAPFFSINSPPFGCDIDIAELAEDEATVSMNQLQAEPKVGNSLATQGAVSIWQRVRAVTNLATRCTFVLVVFLAGCASAPPRGQANLVDFLADGHTTREQTLLKLGEPNAKFNGERIFTYRLGMEAKNHGYYIVHSQTGINGWPSWTGVKYSLVLVFDEAGVLQKHSLLEVN